MMRVPANLIEAPAAEKGEPAKISSRKSQEILDLHRQWIDSKGSEGQAADLSRVNLEGTDFTDAMLRGADLNQAVLRGADLLLADLQGASLLQTDLSDANLLGTKFREADLQGAKFTGAKALIVEQLAGANLSGALLP